MIPFPIANVVLDGRLVTSSLPAVVERGTVMTPIEPFVLRFASAVAPSDGTIIITRGPRSIRIEPGRARAETGGASLPLPIAPYLRDGRVIIPLAAVARSLGLDVYYDQQSRSAYLSSYSEPLATMTPFVTPRELPLPVPTFTAEPVPEPRPVFTGTPKARRTPIEVSAPGW